MPTISVIITYRVKQQLISLVLTLAGFLAIERCNKARNNFKDIDLILNATNIGKQPQQFRKNIAAQMANFLVSTCMFLLVWHFLPLATAWPDVLQHQPERTKSNAHCPVEARNAGAQKEIQRMIGAPFFCSCRAAGGCKTASQRRNQHYSVRSIIRICKHRLKSFLFVGTACQT